MTSTEIATNRQYRLAARPAGLPTDDMWERVEEPVAAPREGELPDDPYRMAALRGRVVEVRPDHACHQMDQIAFKYTSSPFPSRGLHRICFVIAIECAWLRTLAFDHNPGNEDDHVHDSN